MISFALSLVIWSSFQQLIACMPMLVAAQVRLAQDQAALWSFLEERRKQLKASEEEAAAAQQVGRAA